MEVSLTIKETLLEINPKLDIEIIPVSDGGENTIETLKSILPYNEIFLEVTGPNQYKVKSSYLILNNNVAFIESSKACGLNIAIKGSNPLFTTTYGVGELIKDAYNKGCKEIYISLGGTATNDVGSGLLSALGISFYDEDNKEFIPTGASLINIKKYDIRALKTYIKDVKFNLLTDVDNCLLGKSGASYMFAKQKGASDSDIIKLEEGVSNLVNIIKVNDNVDINNILGGGAAGGMGAGCFYFLNANITSGIETILKLINFDNKIKNSNLIITGEGKIDNQTKHGKLIKGITEHAKIYNIPVIAIAGKCELNKDEIKELGVSKIIETNPKEKDIEILKKSAKSDLKASIFKYFDNLII